MLNAYLRLPLIPVLVLVALAAGIGLIMVNNEYDWQGFVLVIVGLGVLAAFLIPRLARLEGSHNLHKVLALALLAKFAFAMIRYSLAFGIYGGVADAAAYNRKGAIIAQYIHALDFASIAPHLHWGTSFMNVFTGVIYAITGPSIYAGYIVYAFLAFLGSYFFYRAFLLAFPQGNTKLFLLLIFFFPSLLYWPNGIGKDAIISLFIGISAYGSAQLARNQMKGLVTLAIGLVGVTCVRPHIAAVFALALALALVLHVSGRRSVRPVIYIIGLIGVIAIIWLALPRLAAELGIQELSTEGVLSTFMQHQDFTFEGGSAFQVTNIGDPIRLPIDLLSLMFRPFPWQAHNLQALVQAMEGMLLLVLVVWRVRNIGRALVASMSDAYLRYILFSIFGSLIAFIIIANYGILARERCMMLPFVLMLLAYERRSPVPAITKEVSAPVRYQA